MAAAAGVVLGGLILDKLIGLISGVSKRQTEELRGQLAEQQRMVDMLLEDAHKSKITSLSSLSEHDQKTFDEVIQLCKEQPAYRLLGRNAAVFGVVSTGKSSLINALLGREVAETGIGETTLEFKSYQGIGLTYWDCPGKHDQLTYLTADYISLIKGLTIRIIVVDITLKHMTGFISMLQRLNLPFIVVLNKWDAIAKASEAKRTKFEATIAEEIAQYCPGVPIFRVAAEQPGHFQWDDLVQHITS